MEGSQTFFSKRKRCPGKRGKKESCLPHDKEDPLPKLLCDACVGVKRKERAVGGGEEGKRQLLN